MSSLGEPAVVPSERAGGFGPEFTAYLEWGVVDQPPPGPVAAPRAAANHEPVSFASHLRPLCHAGDRSSMSLRSPSGITTTLRRTPAILARLEAGSIPLQRRPAG
jgi:hypothetical protein